LDVECASFLDVMNVLFAMKYVDVVLYMCFVDAGSKWKYNDLHAIEL